jgi:hypothetical protein
LIRTSPAVVLVLTSLLATAGCIAYGPEDPEYGAGEQGQACDATPACDGTGEGAVEQAQSCNAAEPCDAPKDGKVEEEQVGTAEQRWDSQDGNPTHATHSYMTEYAMDQLKGSFPALNSYRANLIDGSNRELHELTLSDPELESLRVQAGGTNWSADRPDVIWSYARYAYSVGNLPKAYYYLGIVLHCVEDMGAPVHAYRITHQGTFSEMDNFEALALVRWAPDYRSINRSDPGYARPSDYVAWSGNWAASDFQSTWPGATYSRGFFSMTWLTASTKQGNFVKARQGRTATATAWTLRSALTHW